MPAVITNLSRLAALHGDAEADRLLDAARAAGSTPLGDGLRLYAGTVLDGTALLVDGRDAYRLAPYDASDVRLDSRTARLVDAAYDALSSLPTRGLVSTARTPDVRESLRVALVPFLRNSAALAVRSDAHPATPPSDWRCPTCESPRGTVMQGGAVVCINDHTSF